MKTIAERRAERACWSDARLTAELLKAAAGERSSLIELLLDLVEFDHRSLSQKGAYPTLFAYCTRKLGYSSSEAGRRIAVARKSEKFPLLLEMIERGELHLSGAAMLTGLLTPSNQAEVLRRAKGRTQDEIARLAAALAPKPRPRDSVRPIRAPALRAEIAAAQIPDDIAGPVPAPVPMTGPAPIAGPAPSSIPLPPSVPALPVEPDLFGNPIPPPAPEPPDEAELFEISFPATAETKSMLARAGELLRHRFPKGELNDIVNFALKNLLARIDRDLRKTPRARKPHPASASGSDGAPRPERASRGRYIPETVKQEAWRRDGGQCAFVAADGTRCSSRAWLEFDHAVPYALGGSSSDAANIRPYCRPHNAWAAEQIFGPRPGGSMNHDTS